MLITNTAASFTNPAQMTALKLKCLIYVTSPMGKLQSHIVKTHFNLGIELHVYGNKKRPDLTNFTSF